MKQGADLPQSILRASTVTGRESYDKDVLIPAGIELVSSTDLESNPGKETAKTKTRVYPNGVLIPHEIELIPRKDLESVRG